MNTRQALLQTLQNIKSLIQEGEHQHDFGLCWHVGTYSNDNYELELFQEMSTQWPSFSGDGDFPIALPDEHPRDTYINYADKYKGEYGKLRMALLDWCINELENN